MSKLHEYIVSLSLSYFKTCGEAYSINELINLLGLNQYQMDKLIAYLKENNFIEYINYELQITNKGLQYLVIHNQINSSLENGEYKFIHIDKSNAISIETPYVPYKFLTKLR